MSNPFWWKSFLRRRFYINSWADNPPEADAKCKRIWLYWESPNSSGATEQIQLQVADIRKRATKTGTQELMPEKLVFGHCTYHSQVLRHIHRRVTMLAKHFLNFPVCLGTWWQGQGGPQTLVEAYMGGAIVPIPSQVYLGGGANRPPLLPSVLWLFCLDKNIVSICFELCHLLIISTLRLEFHTTPYHSTTHMRNQSI